MDMFFFLSMHIYMYAHVHALIHSYARTHIHAHTYTYICTRICIHTYIPMYVRKQIFFMCVCMLYIMQ